MPRKFSEETRQRMADAAKRRWQRSEEHERLSASVRQQWQDPAYRSLQDNARTTKAYRDVHRAAMQKRWQDPTTKAKMAQSPEVRGNASRQARLKNWQDPAYRATMQQHLKRAAKKLWEETDFAETRPETARQQLLEEWSDPAFREARMFAITHPPVLGDCFYCGSPATERDHVIHRSRGGTDDPENIVLACRSCNASKYTLTGAEYQEKLFRKRQGPS